MSSLKSPSELDFHVILSRVCGLVVGFFFSPPQLQIINRLRGTAAAKMQAEISWQFTSSLQPSVLASQHQYFKTGERLALSHVPLYVPRNARLWLTPSELRNFAEGSLCQYAASFDITLMPKKPDRCLSVGLVFSFKGGDCL